MPNNFALLVLIIWPIVGVAIFRIIKDREKAIIASLFWSYLFLPSGVGFDLPAIPPLDKQSIPALVLLLLVLFSRSEIGGIVPKGRLVWLLLVSFVVGSFMTAITNMDPILIADYTIPGSRLRDAFSAIAKSLLFIVPFLLGYSLLRTKSAQFKILHTLVISGLIYSIILLIEVRISPQFHIWVYGFFPHSFLQAVRSGGFRPIGFMWHGLYAAFFIMMCCVSACILMKERVLIDRIAEIANNRMSFGIVSVYFLFVLVLCKSLGSIIFCVFLIPCILFFSPKIQIIIAAMLVSIAIMFPILRGNNIFPTETIIYFAESISEERAESLNVRFENEDELLARAQERPFFGWGSWGRNRIFDADTGRDISTLDGFWVALIGTSGWVGFLAIFGMLGAPVFMNLWRYRGEAVGTLSPMTSGLCLLLAVNMIELLPNSTRFPWTWLIAGALWGHAMSERGLESGPRQRQRQRTIL